MESLGILLDHGFLIPGSMVRIHDRAPDKALQVKDLQGFSFSRARISMGAWERSQPLDALFGQS
jgi:hypothetical protein